jgi:hypothetical protein
MTAIIGRYRIDIEEDSFIVTHQAGIKFDLTRDEAVGLLDFLISYQDILSHSDPDTDPRMKRVILRKDDRMS